MSFCGGLKSPYVHESSGTTHGRRRPLMSSYVGGRARRDAYPWRLTLAPRRPIRSAMGNMPATSTHLDLLHGHPSAPISSAEGLATCQTAQTAAPSSGAQVNITIVTCNPTSGSQFFICNSWTTTARPQRRKAWFEEIDETDADGKAS